MNTIKINKSEKEEIMKGLRFYLRTGSRHESGGVNISVFFSIASEFLHFGGGWWWSAAINFNPFIWTTRRRLKNWKARVVVWTLECSNAGWLVSMSEVDADKTDTAKAEGCKKETRKCCRGRRQKENVCLSKRKRKGVEKDTLCRNNQNLCAHQEMNNRPSQQRNTTSGW